MAGRLRVGVIGCGLIAQVMHLPYLRELSDRFTLTAVCDISDDVRAACAREYGVPEQYSSWQELIARPLDAVLVLTSGSHAPIAIAAARAGLHALVEKPMCFSVAAGQLSRWAYRNVLLDSLVHELNAMRGALGEPDSLDYAEIRETGLTVLFSYGRTQCILAWVDLPAIARYSMEFAFYSPDRRITL